LALPSPSALRPGKKVIKLFLTIIVVVLLAGVLRAPVFLVCERPLKKADCVIAMLGGDFAVRKREALSLVEKGVADTMLIPARRMSFAPLSRLRWLGQWCQISIAFIKYVKSGVFTFFRTSPE